MNILEIITKKRDNHSLSSQEIKWVVSQYSAGDLPDYQMSALLMAITLNGMDREETCVLAQAMIFFAGNQGGQAFHRWGG